METQLDGKEAMIWVDDLSFRYSDHEVLSGVCLTVRPGSFVGIIGPNGSGKTTLLRCLAKYLRPTSGRIALAGRDLQNLPLREVARSIGVVSQDWQSAFAFSVREMVMMGRLPHMGRFARESAADRRIVQEVLQRTQIAHLADQPITQLSGGERQRVIIAQALAQSPAVLLLDEPTAHLDLRHQLEIAGLIGTLSKREGLTAVAVLHDLNLAAQFCDYLVLLSAGRIQAAGEPGQVLTAANLERVYGTAVKVGHDPATGRPVVSLGPGPAAQEESGPPRAKVHVIGGGGTAVELYWPLRALGCSLSTGVLHVQDDDWRAAKEMRIDTIEEAPFSPIGDASHARNLALLKEADLVILSCIPVGPGNLKNLQAAVEAARAGKPLVVCDFTPMAERDFTGGSAVAIRRDLQANGASSAATKDELRALTLHWLEGTAEAGRVQAMLPIGSGER